MVSENYVLSFDSAKAEKKNVMVAQEDMEGNISSYATETVTLVTLRPGSSMKVSGGVNIYGNTFLATGDIGEIVGPNRFVMKAIGAQESVFYDGPVEKPLPNAKTVCSPTSFSTNAPTYYVILGAAESTASTASGFTDVKPGAYYADAVQWAIKNKITAGTSATTFSPNASCTTGHILTFLWRAKGSPEPSIKNPFSNVKSTDYFYKASLWAKEKGLVSGKTFQGNTLCTRGEAMTYLWILAGKPPVGDSAFQDVPTSASYAKAVAWAVREGITSGTSATTFQPKSSCTRGQIVTFLYRALG